MRWGVILGVLALVAVAGMATASQPPLADAGLDQDVDRGETVLIDAMGSSDPDGEITAYRWHIEAPDGTAVSPACADCAWTRFRATRVGRYTVTVTVTDDSGATQSDFLYVDVGPAPGPSGGPGGPAGGGAVPPSTGGGAGSPAAGSTAPAVGGGPSSQPGTTAGEPAPALPSIELNRNSGSRWLGPGGTPELGGSPRIVTYPTVSPFGTDVGGVSYFIRPNGQSRASTDGFVEVINELI